MHSLRLRPAVMRLGAILVASACLGDPVGPGLLTVSLVDGAIDSVLVGTPGTLLPSPVRLRVTDGRGSPIPGATLTWEAIGNGAQVFGASTQTNLAGEAVARWQLGTNAAEEQQLRIAVHTTRKETQVALRAQAVPSVVAQLRLALDTPVVLRLGDTLPAPVVAIDPFGNEFSAPDVILSVDDTAIGAVRGPTLVGGPRRGRTIVQVSSHGRQAAFSLNVTQFVSAIVAAVDTIQFNSLGAELPVGYEVRDDRGWMVSDTTASISVADTQVVSVLEGRVRSVADGQTVLRLALGAATKTVAVQVQQRAVRVEFATDTLWFTALGDTMAVTATAVDSLGFPVREGDIDSLTVTPAGIVEVIDATTFTAVANGSAQVTFTAAGVPARLSVVVSQVPHSIAASVNYPKPILTLPAGASFPVTCAAADRNGFAIPDEPVLVESKNGTVSGRECSGLRIDHSGVDTLTIGLGNVRQMLPVVVAAAPISSSPVGDFLQADSIPAGAPWAPTAYINSRGLIEVDFAVYRDEAGDSTSMMRAHLHRVVSTDGTSFSYDGVVLSHSDTVCSYNGQGIENVAVVPRADAPGWRMFYASGSSACWGWQVFSAVSADGVTWQKEPGIRLSNETPAATAIPPYPVGEGMVVDQLPNGEWRMIAGTFEHTNPALPDNWAIAEWRSPDQMNWSYRGTVFTTDQMPPEGQRGVYSPTIAEFAPGLWRMIFTADNRTSPGGRSAIWSAVSTDRVNWQLEGRLLGSSTTNLLYSSLVANRLVFLRWDDGGVIRLGLATISMP